MLGIEHFVLHSERRLVEILDISSCYYANVCVLQLPKSSTFICDGAYSYITPFIRLPWTTPTMQYSAQAVPEDGIY